MQPATVALDPTATNAAQPAAGNSAPAQGTSSFAQTLASKVDTNNTPQQTTVPTSGMQAPTFPQPLATELSSKAQTKAQRSSASVTTQSASQPNAHVNLPANVTVLVPVENIAVPAPVAVPPVNPARNQTASQDEAGQPSALRSNLSALPGTFLPNVASAVTTSTATASALPQQRANQAGPNSDVLPGEAPVPEDAIFETSAALPARTVPVANWPTGVEAQTTSPEALHSSNTTSPELQSAQAHSSDSENTPPTTAAMVDTSPASQPLPTPPPPSTDVIPQAPPSPAAVPPASDVAPQTSPVSNAEHAAPANKAQKLPSVTLPPNTSVRVNAAGPTISNAKSNIQVDETVAANDLALGPVLEGASASAVATDKKWDYSLPSSETKTNLPAETTIPGAFKIKEQSSTPDNGHSGAQDPSPQKDTNSSASSNGNEATAIFAEPKTTNDAKSTASEPPATTVSAVAATTNENAAPVAATQGNTLPNPLVNEHAATQAAAKDNTPLASSSDAQPSPASTPANPSLNDTHEIVNAQIAGNAQQSEIHLAMQVDRLGPVELHAHVSGEQMGAAILVEKREAHAALAVELPALQQALSDKNLRVEHVWLTQSALHSTAGDAGTATGQQSRQQAGTRTTATNPFETRSTPLTLIPEQDGIFDERGHLSVRA